MVAVWDCVPKRPVTTAAQVLGYASGTANGAAMDSAGMHGLLRLVPHEQAICFVVFGTSMASCPPRQRPRPEEFVSISDPPDR